MMNTLNDDEVFSCCVLIGSMRKETVEYAKKYMGKLDEIKVRIPKGRKEDIEAHAQQKGQSVNGLIVSLLQEELNMTEDDWKKAPDELV